jgi:riboflavin biosynthesis pyrimidine reductase
VRVLIGLDGQHVGEVSDDALVSLYAAPRPRWLRANMISSIDGAASGDSGLSGSLNNAADHRIFAMLRAQADVVLVGAGTAEAEGYGPVDVPIVVVTRRGRLPAGLRDADAGQVLLATCEAGLANARGTLADAQLLVHGEDTVDLAAVLDDLALRGMPNVLCEGGPHLLGDLLTAGLVDEVAMTTVALWAGGDAPRVVAAGTLSRPARLGLLLEEDGTLFARWLVERSPVAP